MYINISLLGLLISSLDYGNVKATSNSIFSCASFSFLPLENLKGLSHWRRRRRDWSVAATRETKNWLALSSRRRCRDCRDWSVVVTRETKTWLALSRHGDVSDTCWRQKKSPPPKKKKIEHVWISRDSPEIRLVSRRRRRDVSTTSGDSSRHLVSRPVR